MDRAPFAARMALACFAAFCANASATPVSPSSHWSVDLKVYGYPEQHCCQTGLAASNDFVALATEVPVEPWGKPIPRRNASYQASILLFRADRGTLEAKCGPWVGNGSLDLWSTAQGNFLVLLGDLFATPKGSPGRRLLLISSSCKKLKELDLPSTWPQSNWGVLLSPSRRTLLLYESPWGPGRDVQIRDADTFALRSEWTVHSKGSHQIIALNDVALLGADPGKLSDYQPPRYIRPFDGQWRRLPVDRADAFLSAGRLVWADAPFTNYLKTGKSTVVAAGIDGTPILSRVISGFQYTVFPINYVPAEASDGLHFGWIFDFAAAGWFWGNLDMGPEHQTIYIWCAPDYRPVAKIRIWHEYSGAMALPPNGDWVTWQDGSKLNLRRFPKR